MIPPVVASDRGRAQTFDVAMHQRGCRTAISYAEDERDVLESSAAAGDSPLREVRCDVAVS